MNTNDWIKMTDRAPTEDDLPVWVYNSKGVCLTGVYHFCCTPSAYSWTHWRPAKADVPEPPREETQYDKDAAALLAYANGRNMDPLFTHRTFWHAALAYERAEVRKLMPGVSASWAYRDAIEQIRARCGGGGK